MELLQPNDPRLPIAGAYGAIYNSLDSSLNPVAFTQGLTRPITTRGSAVFTDTTVTSFAKLPNGFSLTTDKGHKIRARSIICATSTWPEAGKLNTSLSCYSLPLISYIAVTEPVKGLRQRWKDELIWNTYKIYNYLRILPDERVLIGGEDQWFGSPTLHGNSSTNSEYAQRLLAKLRAYFPDLDFKIQTSWSGYLAYPIDGLPIIQTRGGVSSIITDGLPFGWLMGQIAADRITGGRSEYDDLYDYQRDVGVWKNLFLRLPLPDRWKGSLIKMGVAYEQAIDEIDKGLKY